MKKILTVIISLICISFSLCAEKNLLSFSFGLSTGIPVYQSQTIKEEEEYIEANRRFVIGTYAYANINIIDYASVFAGAELLSDFNWNGKNYSNHLDLDFPLGLRLSPGLAGFSFGTAYLLGFRGDFYKNDFGKANTATPWGNGFKLFAEYDFSNQKYKFLPTIGLSWNIMPRGNNEYDNLLSLYLGLNI